jgi:sarcosine oxidase
MAQGTEMILGNVAGTTLARRRVASIQMADGTVVGCGNIVNAAGTGAAFIASLAGFALPVLPRKRYVYAVDCPSASEELHRAPLTVDPSGVYFRPEGRQFLCGLSPREDEEPESNDWEVDYRWFDERVWPMLAARVRSFERIKVMNAWVGYYDYNTLDQNAIIGPHPEVENFYFVNGFSGHGMQQGPAAGNAIAELIIHGAYRSIDLTRFGYERVINNDPLRERNVI